MENINCYNCTYTITVPSELSIETYDISGDDIINAVMDGKIISFEKIYFSDNPIIMKINCVVNNTILSSKNTGLTSRPFSIEAVSLFFKIFV